MFQAVIGWAMKLLPVIPQLIVSIEQLFRGTPKAGPQKWIAVEQALSQSITLASGEIAQLAPAGTKAETISAALAVFSKDVNDAFVKLANDLKLFTSTAPTA